MKILYAIQATGNGHLSRAIEIVPAFQKYGTVDIFVSGTQSQVQLPFPISYQKHGLSFVFGKKGGVNIIRSLSGIRPIKLWKDIRTCPVESYDLIVNDFEPITAYAAKRKGIPCIAMSHQSAFLSELSPRPTHKNVIAEWMFRNYAPVKKYVGFHFQSYDKNIFQPIIKNDIKNLAVSEKEHICVYLPAYSPQYLQKYFFRHPDFQWRIFAKNVKERTYVQNVEINPISHEYWHSSLASCYGVIMGSGFEGPAEALYLKKRLLVVPMKNQYEQKCNAEALHKMGVHTCMKIKQDFGDILKNWLFTAKVIPFKIEHTTEEVVEHLMCIARKAPLQKQWSKRKA